MVPTSAHSKYEQAVDLPRWLFAWKDASNSRPDTGGGLESRSP